MGARAMTPKPPPGFDLITQQAVPPPPPPGFEMVSGPPPAAKPHAELRAYEPTWRETIGGYISDMFGNTAEGDRVASGLVGSTGLGHTRMSVSDVTPARIPLYAQEAKRSYERGDMGQASLDALGATPVPILNKGVEAAVAVAKPIVTGAKTAGTQIAARTPKWLSGKEADVIANDVLATRIQRSGSSADAIEADLAAGQRSARLDSNSRATLPETLADTSDNMQRLTGAVYRTGGEASEIVKPRLEARQRGPENPYAPRTDDLPQGQLERIVDDFDRALNVKSSKGARATATELEAAQKAKADELYTRARENSEPFNLEPALTAWSSVSQQYQGPFRDKLVSAINLFADPMGKFTRWNVDNIQRFDNAKKILDDMIEASKGEFGKATNLTRELTRFKNDLLERVHEGGKNKLYRQARDEFGTAVENKEAITLGQKALRGDSEISVETFRAMSPAQQKLFRIGLRDAVRLALSTRKPGDNSTLLLQQRRVRDLLNEVIPTPRGKAAEFADRPERFGDLMRREERMAQTRNMVLGNSATAMRHQDDAELAADTLARVITGGRTLLNVGLEFVGNSLQKVFGYRRDVAAELARKLLDQDPATRAHTLQAIREASDTAAFSAFAQQLRQSRGALPLLPASAGDQN